DTSPDADTATMEERHAREDPLLPHLSFKVRSGDSLVQEVGGINLGRMETTKGLPPDLKNRLNKLKSDKQDYYHNYTERHPKSKQALEWEEFQLFRAILQHRIHIKQEEQKKHLRTIEVLEGERALIGGEPVITKKNEAEIVIQKQLIAEKEFECKQYQQALESLKLPKNVPFVWEIAFAEVFVEEKDRGFDIVIGNPPYVRQEQILDPRLPRIVAMTRESKQLYKTKLARSVYQAFTDFFRYNEMKGTAIHKIDLKSDLYIYFYLYGLKLLNPKGTFCFITSNSWLDVGYGADLQEFLLKYCRIKMILDNQVKRSFSTADVNTVISLFSAPSEKPGEEELNHIARFVMFKVTFEHILSADIFKQIEQTQERTATPEYRVYPIIQKALLEEGLKPLEKDVKEVTLSERTGKLATSPLLKEA
ncbi:MAG TPA: Eco57I restriction-modification methylase domain-containing protein, partial [Methylomirabilota bacterium]|nr:Eco57I restriction-modification methylase domain-containing protein [Methylomirabilota bacterium]